MSTREHRPLRGATTALLVGLVVVLLLPMAWSRVGLAGGRWLWDDVPPNAAPGSTTDGEPRQPEGPAEGDQRITPGTIPARGTVIEPTGPRPSVPPTSSPCAFSETVGGDPIRWDPATPIPFEVRRPAGPPNGLDLVFEALQRISNASGYRFEYRGLTDDLAPFESRSIAPGETSPLWIGWAFDDEVPELKNADVFDTHALGVGGPRWVEGPGEAHIDGGAAVLRADEDLAHRFGAGRTVGNVLLHEVLHAMNLDHVEDPQAIMSPSLSSETSDGLGELEIRALQALFDGTDCA